MNKLLVILGPTATGKTDLALRLASLAQGELISVDSRQIYVGLDIGTGKLPSERWKIDDRRWKRGKGWWEMDGIKIWMYDVAEPKRQYTVYDFVKDANRVIGEIYKRGKLPIIVGGTGFYLKALLEGLPNLTIPVDRKLRKELSKLSLGQLQKKLEKVSLPRWEQMNVSDRQNSRRLVRAIELAVSNHGGVLRLASLAQDDKLRLGIIRSLSNVLKIGLTAPRGTLYKRIDERVVSRIKQGMIDEARNLYKDGLTFKRMRQLGLEYGVLADFLQGRVKTEDEFIRIMQNKIHAFARRQSTWFKKEKNVFWFDITNRNYYNKVENLVTKWYDNFEYATEN